MHSGWYVCALTPSTAHRYHASIARGPAAPTWRMTLETEACCPDLRLVQAPAPALGRAVAWARRVQGPGGSTAGPSRRILPRRSGLASSPLSSLRTSVIWLPDTGLRATACTTTASSPWMWYDCCEVAVSVLPLTRCHAQSSLHDNLQSNRLSAFFESVYKRAVAREEGIVPRSAGGALHRRGAGPRSDTPGATMGASLCTPTRLIAPAHGGGVANTPVSASSNSPFVVITS